MTISSTTVRNSYSGDNSTTTFSYTFKIFQDSDIQVIIRSATGTETIKTITTHYTVTGAGASGGGSVIFTSGNIPTSTQTVVLRRNIPQTQAIDYIANDPFPAESHEEGLDRATMAIQQLQEELQRSIKLSKTNTMTSTEFTVGATARANKILAFDASGEISVTQELGTYRGNWSSGVTFNARDIVKDSSNNNIYIANTTHTSTGTTPISSNVDVAKWDLIVDAAAASTSATNAATSASTATTQATNAASSASAASSSASSASSSASSASSSASTATTQATNASNSATSAAASAASAATILDNFDDIYLGAKSSAPTLDNDGGALNAGDLYFNTTSNSLQIYSGSVWQTATNARTVVIADAASITINADITDVATQANTQAVGTLTINAPSGTPVNGQKILLRLRSTNVQTFSFNAIFTGSDDLSLPTTSSGATKYDYLGFVYNSTATKWQLVGKVFGF
jgi:hypothetical protein